MSAASADALLKALIGSGSIGSSNQPIYYKDGKLYAGGYKFRLNHNTTDDKIPVFSNGVLDYILKSELANATTGGGIVAANLAQNGYVKFSNGLILQWGRSTEATLNFSIPFQKFYCITTGQESWSSATFNNTSWIVRTNSSITWPTYMSTAINYIAVGI